MTNTPPISAYVPVQVRPGGQLAARIRRADVDDALAAAITALPLDGEIR